MKKITNIFLIILTISLLTTGCANSNYQHKREERETIELNKNEKITVEKAKEIIDTKNPIIIDVREQSEYNEGHIKNSILIPLNNIETEIEQIVPNKNDLVLIYCRSGNRSGQAFNKLKSLGYTNIKDFGGIINWPYDIET